MTRTCHHCGQDFLCAPGEALLLCERCEAELRDERHERMRLFEPAPAVMSGQVLMWDESR